MKRLASLLVIAVILAAGLSSCGKYEDGPKLSFRSKSARLCHEWKVQSVFEVVTVDEVDVTVHWADLEIDFNKNGTYTSTKNSVISTGKWEFSDDKEQLRLTLDDATTPDVFVIRRLTKEELWLNSEVASKITKFKFAIKK